jgi:hypothetical protein
MHAGLRSKNASRVNIQIDLMPRQLKYKRRKHYKQGLAVKIKTKKKKFFRLMHGYALAVAGLLRSIGNAALVEY